MNITAQNDDSQWFNKETASAAKAIYALPSLYKMITEILYNCNNAGDLTDKLEGLMWILWGATTPKPDRADMKAVDWSQIANRIIDDNGLSWDDFKKEYS